MPVCPSSSVHVLTLWQASPTPVITQASALYLPQSREHKRSMYNTNYKAEVVISQQPGCSRWTRNGSQGVHPSTQAYLWLPADAHSSSRGTGHRASACSQVFAPTCPGTLTTQLAAFFPAAEDSACCSPSGKISDVSLNSPSKQAQLNWLILSEVESTNTNLLH